MSGTTTPSTQTTTVTSGSPTATGVASAGSGLGVGVLLTWFLKQFGVDMPADVAMAAVTVITMIVHAVAMWVVPPATVVTKETTPIRS